jgi:hypothetical protein
VSKYLLPVVFIALTTPLAAQTPAPAAPATPVVRQKMPDDSVALARKYVAWLWSNQIDSIIAVSDNPPADYRQRMVDQLASIAARAGTEQSVVEEKWIRRNGNRQYWRTARFSDFTDEPLVLRIVMMPNGKIAGLGFGPLSQVPPVDQEP